MTDITRNNADPESIYLAGELAPAGLYQRLDTPHTVRLLEKDYLPATLDGRVACYTRIALWADLNEVPKRKRTGKRPFVD